MARGRLSFAPNRRRAASGGPNEGTSMKILITGGAGHVGRKLRGEFSGRFDLIRTFDRVDAPPLGPNEESQTGDISDMAAVERAMQGMDAVIHLAAQPNEAPFEPILQANVIGTWNV